MAELPTLSGMVMPNAQADILSCFANHVHIIDFVPVH